MLAEIRAESSIGPLENGTGGRRREFSQARWQGQTLKSGLKLSHLRMSLAFFGLSVIIITKLSDVL